MAKFLKNSSGKFLKDANGRFLVLPEALSSYGLWDSIIPLGNEYSIYFSSTGPIEDTPTVIISADFDLEVVYNSYHWGHNEFYISLDYYNVIEIYDHDIYASFGGSNGEDGYEEAEWLRANAKLVAKLRINDDSSFSLYQNGTWVDQW